MKVSLEWVRDFVDLPREVTAAGLAHDLTLTTVEVEDVVTVGDDTILEIDNKSLTNRPDLWGHYGIARELAAIYRTDLKPLPHATLPSTVDKLVGRLDPALCSRFAAVEFTLDGAGGAATTPAWIRDRLARIGEASVSLCVDLSNYVMFTVGQPTHVYDADTLTLPLSAELTAADENAELELLTGLKVRLVGTTPVVRDGNRIVGLAGVMGSADSVVTAASRRFVLEAATFAPQPIRRASQRLALRTEASARYEKGMDTARVDQAVGWFLYLLAQAAPDATLVGAQDAHPAPTARTTITVTRPYLDRRIGQPIDDAEIGETLGRLGFNTSIDVGDGTITVTTPTWRSTGDVSGPHDIVEEVARVHGYDRLAVAPVAVALEPVRSRHAKPLDRTVREQLASRGGLHEVVTYPWTADHLLAAAGIDKATTVRFAGAPAPDRDSLRPSLIPTLLEAVETNVRHQLAFGIFEVGVVFGGGPAAPYRDRYEVMPPQSTQLGLALVGADGVELFRRAKGLLEMVRRRCHLTDLTLGGDTDVAWAGVGWADPSARLAITAHGQRVGALAVLTPKAKRLAGITAEQVVCAELGLDTLTVHTSRENRFTPLPDLPEADFDLSVVVADDVPWTPIERAAHDAHDLVSVVSYVDEFRGSWVPPDHRSLTMRITLRPTDTTLTADVIQDARNGVLDALGSRFAAHLR